MRNNLNKVTVADVIKILESHNDSGEIYTQLFNLTIIRPIPLRRKANGSVYRSDLHREHNCDHICDLPNLNMRLTFVKDVGKDTHAVRDQFRSKYKLSGIYPINSNIEIGNMV